MEVSRAGTEETTLAGGARSDDASDGTGLAPGAVAVVEVAGPGLGGRDDGAPLAGAAGGGSAAAASGSPTRGRSRARAAADAAKRARVEQQLGQPPEASASASPAASEGGGQVHGSGRERPTGGEGFRAVMRTNFQRAWGLGGGQAAAFAPVAPAGKAELAGERPEDPQAIQVAEKEADRDLRATWLGLELEPALAHPPPAPQVVAAAQVVVGPAVAPADGAPHWESGWAAADVPKESGWWSGQWGRSPSLWGADSADGPGTDSAGVAVGYAGVAAGPASASRGAGVPWAQAAAAGASTSPGPLGRKGGNWGKSLLALLRHGGSKDKSGNRPFARHLVNKDVPDLAEAQWATLEALGSEMRILMVRKLLSYILFREEEGLQTEDRVARHFVLGELGAGGINVFLGALQSDERFGTAEEAEWARSPHLVIRSGTHEAPRRVRISGSDFAGLVEHLAPMAQSPWIPELGGLAVDGRTHQLDWVHDVTKERIVGQVPLL